MIVFLASGFRTTRYRLRRLWAWAVLHPKTAMVLMLAVCWLVSAIIAVPAAYADGSANSSAPPYMPPTDLKDSDGVPLWRYSVLPLDRGDVWHPTKTVLSMIVDGVWILNLACLSWCLWLLSFLLEFTWVDWIATPVGAIAGTMQSVLSQIGWPAIALMVAGGVFGMAIALGKFARGTIDLSVSILCFVLATGALANPVTALTGDHGALTWAQSTGANLSVSVLDTKGADPTGTPDKAQAQQMVSQSLMGGLIDVFVRIPAQEVAFGHSLSGQCDTTFTNQMKNASAYDTSSNSVRDAVGSCDKEAQDYVTHPSMGQVITALSIMGGSGTLLLIALAMALVCLIAVIYALLSAFKLMGYVYAAMLPGVAREGLWSSFIGMYVGALSVGVSIVTLAAYLRILSSVMKAASEGGLPIVAQTAVINIFVIALIITLISIYIRMRKKGVRVAQWLAKLGYGGNGQPSSMSPIGKEALRTAGRYAANRLSQRPQKKALPAAPEPSSVDGGHLTATTSRAASGAGRVLRAASTVGQLGAAAATGGTSAVAIKTAQIGGRKVLQRHALSAGTSAVGNVLEHKTARPGSSTAPAAIAPAARAALTSSKSSGFPAGRTPAIGPGSTPAPTPPAQSTAVPFGRQIVVDKSGVGQIAPAAQNRGGVYQVTRMRPNTVQQSPVRAALERAAKKELVS